MLLDIFLLQIIDEALVPSCKVSPDLRHAEVGASPWGRKALKNVEFHCVVGKGLLGR